MRLRGKTLGIIGFGNVGKRFAEICHALGLRILIVSKFFDQIKNDFPHYISSNLNNVTKMQIL